MTDLRLRNVEPGILDVIREMARQRRLTTEQFLKAELASIADREKAAFLDRLQVLRDEQTAVHGIGPDSTPGIRAEREARW